MRGYPGPERAGSSPNGYPVQQPSAPAGNPYGSFVSQPAASYPQQAAAAYPQQPAASYSDSSYSDSSYPDSSYPAASYPAASYPEQPAPVSPQPAAYSGYADHSQQAQDGGWYGSQAPVNGAGHAQAMPALSTSAEGYQYNPSHDQAGGYYPGYQAPQADSPGYPQPVYQGGQYDQRGYNGQEPSYSQDAYPGYPGYGSGGY